MKLSSQLLLITLAIVAGAIVPVQSAINTVLSRSLQSSLYGVLVVFLVASLTITAAIVFRQEQLPTLMRVGQVPFISWWSGGVLGAAYIFLLVYLSPKLGLGTVTGLVVVGQLLSAITIDHLGLFGFPLHPLQWQRFIGALLLCAGVYLVKKF